MRNGAHYGVRLGRNSKKAKTMFSPSRNSIRGLGPVGCLKRGQLVKFKYYQTVSINAPLGAMGWHTFNANGLYDPDFTGTGHQPLGFDEWMKFYAHYTVMSAKVTCWHPARNDNGVVLMARVAADNSTIVDIPTNMEQEGTKYAIGNTENGILKATASVDIRKFLGRRTMDSETLRGSNAANPVEGVSFQIGIGPLDQVSDFSAGNVNVLIEFTAQLSEPRDLIGS